MKLRHTVAVCSIFLISTVVYGNDHPQTTRVEQLVLKSGETSNGKISRGTFTVFENRKARGGRKINLNVVVLHANGNQRQPDPVFFLAGGPGQGAAQLWRGFEDSWMRKNRDIVLVSQRGTDGDNRLQLPKANTKSDLQHYLEPIFDLETIPSAIEALSKKADLRMYSTPDATAACAWARRPAMIVPRYWARIMSVNV